LSAEIEACEAPERPLRYKVVGLARGGTTRHSTTATLWCVRFNCPRGRRLERRDSMAIHGPEQAAGLACRGVLSGSVIIDADLAP
jgi:hypothetical protein